MKIQSGMGKHQFESASMQPFTNNMDYCYQLAIQPVTKRRFFTHVFLPYIHRKFALALLLSAIAQFVFLPSSSAQAQTSSWVDPIYIDTELHPTTSVAIGDLNGDGTLDIVMGNDNEPNVIYFNNATINFDTKYALAGNYATTGIAVGDLNGDGLLDIVVGNYNQPNRIYFNQGGGLFGNGEPLAGIYPTQSLALGDVNGDGAIDIVAGNYLANNIVYLNNGIGRFESIIPIPSTAERTTVITLGDLDSDKDLDLVVGTGAREGFYGDGGPLTVYYNDGTGRFNSSLLLPDTLDTESIALGDVNQDGALDIVLGAYDPGIYWNTLAIYLNDKTGKFSQATWPDAGLAVALGDVNGDSALDIVANSGPFLNDYRGVTYVLLNKNDGTGTFQSDNENVLPAEYLSSSLATADMNNDGALDIIEANVTGPSAVYLNKGSVVFHQMVKIPGADYQSHVVVGDLNGDRWLDFVEGKVGENNANLYINNKNGSFEHVAVGVAIGLLGDVDGNATLDMASPDGVYLNNGTGSFSTIHPLPDLRDSNDMILGDVNNDGSLDLVLSHTTKPHLVLYTNQNDSAGNFAGGVPISLSDSSGALALGDLDGDTLLDLVVGRCGQPTMVYINQSNGRFSAGTSIPGNFCTTRIALGDLNGDGYLDLVKGNGSQPTVVYFNNGKGIFEQAQVFSQSYSLEALLLGDINGDGFIDIVEGHGGSIANGITYIYLNNGLGKFGLGLDLGNVGFVSSIAMGDVNRDGGLDLITPDGLNNVVHVWLNLRQSISDFKNTPPRVTLQRPTFTSDAAGYSVSEILENTIIPITYILYDSESDTVGRVELQYSLDGGGKWYRAVPTNTQTSHLATSPYPTGIQYQFNWDTFRSNIFGQSDNVVLRMSAYPQPTPPAQVGTYRYPKQVVGSYQYASFSTMTFPFRLRSTQVRVMRPGAQPVPGALVYRLPATQSSNGQLYTDRAGLPYHTDVLGYLQGRGELGIDDQLIALWPVPATNLITFTHNYTLYQTSAKPTTESLDLRTVLAPGVQVLTVTTENKLLLFNLDVALEWDARQDTQFLEQLRFNLQRTSQILFDWTNGQVALGRVRIFHDAKRNTAVAGFSPWVDGHIRIYATNQMRPNATVGGIIAPKLLVSETIIVDEQPKTIIYGSGQVRIGAIWNRYGESSGSLGEDWPRALAHELGHYLFFLEDDYLGFNEQGTLVTIPAEGTPSASCPGVMNDPYRESQSEFHPATDWLNTGCIKTLAHQSTGRSDWQTITTFYPLTAPAESFKDQNSGPSILPLAVTQLTVISSTTAAQTVAVPLIYLTTDVGSTYLPRNNTQAYLFQGEWLTHLGQQTLDQIQAWGVRPGDRLCIFEDISGYQGCEQITPLDDQVAMRDMGLWQPEIVVTPVTSRTIALNVTVALDDKQLAARLYPSDSPAPNCILLQNVGMGQYMGSFPELSEPAFNGYVHLWVQNETTSSCIEPHGAAVTETVTGYAIGGNPVHMRARRALTRGGGVHMRARRAPVLSTNGQVMVFGAAFEGKAEEEWFFTIQSTSVLPMLPPGRTLVGQAYRLTASANAPDLSGTSISFGYLGEQVPPGEEEFLRLYFWDVNASACQPQPAPCWRPLPTFIDMEYNVASAKTQTAGLYALMSSLEIPLTTVGWNNFAYPISGTRPVQEALAALADAYTVVYGYQPYDTELAWRVYGPDAPDWANDLKELTFGQGYWLYTTKAITLYLSSQESIHAATVVGLTPPATFYGIVVATTDFTPQAGMTITAWIEGQQCGQSQIQEQGGQLVYVIKVAADDATSYSGCGGFGRTVTFQIEGVNMNSQIGWDNTRLWNLWLSTEPGQRIFLPVVQR